MAIQADNKVPVIVLGQSDLCTLGVIRGLGKRDIPVFCVCETEGFIKNSRWYSPVRKKITPIRSHAELSSFLNKLLVEGWTRAVLISCSDSWTIKVANLDSDLMAHFPASIPPMNSLRSLMDKGLLAEILKKHEIHHPRTIIIQNGEDLEKVTHDRIRNWFLKPRDSQTFKKHFERKAFRVQSLQDAVHKYREIASAGFRVVLQEYIPGPASRHYFIDGFIDRKGKIRAAFARQRIRMYPPDFGDSCYLTSIPLDTVAEAMLALEKLFGKMPYRGIFSAEFKWDERDNHFKLLEINTRPWSYIEFAADCGVDVLYMTYLDALEKETHDMFCYRIGKNTFFFPNDIYASIIMIRLGQLKFTTWLNSLLKAKPMVFRVSDPFPALAFYREKILNIFPIHKSRLYKELWQ